MQLEVQNIFPVGRVSDGKHGDITLSSNVKGQLSNCMLNLYTEANPGGRAVSGVGLRPLVCWDCGFESRWGA